MSVAELYPEAEISGRVPPQDLAAEQSVLGAMLLSKSAIDPAADRLEGRDFYHPKNEKIFRVICDLANRSEPADQITVSAELQRRGELDSVGGARYVADLYDGVPTAANVDYYADIVHEKAVQRRLVEVGLLIQQIGQDQAGELATQVDRAQAAVLDVDGRQGVADYRLLEALIPSTIDEIQQIQSHAGQLAGVPSGFDILDKVTTGFRPGQMIVVAARPGVGKSTIGLDFVRAASIGRKDPIPSAIFSLEMTGEEIAMRLLSAESRVAIHHMRGGTMSESDWRAVSLHTLEVTGAPIVIDDSPNMTMPDIRSKARRIKKEHGLGLLVIDYLQLMSSGKKVENRQVEVSEFSRQIKLLAKELEIPVIAISQLNRGSEQGGDKVPQLSQLRESGSIEQDADIVLLLHRPDLVNRDDRPGEADIIVAKNRSGPAGRTLPVSFQGHYSRFVPMAMDPESPGASAGDFAASPY